MKYIADNGVKAVQAAVSGGQYSHADGLFYGGKGSKLVKSDISANS